MNTVSPVGVDVGSTRSLFVATSPGAGPDGAITADATYPRALFAEFQSATHRLGAAPAFDPDCLGDLVARYWPRIRTALEEAADDVVAYASARPGALLAVEDLPQRCQPLVEAAHGGLRWASWVPPVALEILVARAVAAGLPVVRVDPHQTSRRCHVCGEVGELDAETIACSSETCPVDEVGRDRSAALSIAKRAAGVP